MVSGVLGGLESLGPGQLAKPADRLFLLSDGIYEVRTSLGQNRIARVLFCIDRKGRMVLLHGFIKKTQKTPDADLDLARSNKGRHQRGLQ